MKLLFYYIFILFYYILFYFFIREKIGKIFTDLENISLDNLGIAITQMASNAQNSERVPIYNDVNEDIKC